MEGTSLKDERTDGVESSLRRRRDNGRGEHYSANSTRTFSSSPTTVSSRRAKNGIDAQTSSTDLPKWYKEIYLKSSRAHIEATCQLKRAKRRENTRTYQNYVWDKFGFATQPQHFFPRVKDIDALLTRAHALNLSTRKAIEELDVYVPTDTYTSSDQSSEVREMRYPRERDGTRSILRTLPTNRSSHGALE